MGESEAPGFATRIESLRGVAAMMVAVSHSLIVFSVNGITNIWEYSIQDVHGTQAFWTRLLAIPFNGNVAVTIFFVISGFVLGLSLDRRDPRLPVRFATFLAARVFRLYPALLLCIAAIAGYWLWVGAPRDFPNTSEWYRWYHPMLTYGIWWRDELLLGCVLNPVAWTLQVEMLAALALPFLHLLSRARKPALDLAALAALIAAGVVFSNNIAAPQLFVFYLGLMVPTAGRRLIGGIGSALQANLLMGLALAMIFLPLALTGQPLMLNRVVEASGAFIFISALLYGKERALFAALDSRVARTYGRISYSFYLYHFFLLFVLSQVLLVWIPASLTARAPLAVGISLALISVVVTTLVAGLSYQFVEQPGVRLGRWLAQALWAPRPALGELAEGEAE
jgi:peptidoglycan/LPS O-acetylase OafA/YrhL